VAKNFLMVDDEPSIVLPIQFLMEQKGYLLKADIIQRIDKAAAYAEKLAQTLNRHLHPHSSAIGINSPSR